MTTTNFVEVACTAIEEVHKMNMECAEWDVKYTECFPAFVTRKIVIDGKEYGMSIEIKLKEL